MAISEQDFEMGAPRWPWPRSLMARLIDQISRQRPAVIAIDILYSEPSNTEAVITQEAFGQLRPFLYQILSGVELEVQTREGTKVIGPGDPGFDRVVSGAESARAQDNELANTVARAVAGGTHVVLAAQTITAPGTTGLSRPYRALFDAAGGSLGLVGVQLDDDGVLRRYLPYGLDENREFVYGLALAAVAKYQQADLPARPDGNGDVLIGEDIRVKVADGSFLVNFAGPPGAYPTFTAREVLQGTTAASLEDKIVFLGVTDASAEDLQPTPYSGVNRMAGVEFHAAASDTILTGSFIDTAARYQEILLILVMGSGAIALGRFLRPGFGAAGAVALAGALFGGWFGAFAQADYLLPLAAPLTALVLGYAFSLADHVGVEQLEKQQARSMLSRYLPEDAVKEMLKDPAAARLGVKRAELTILFADIRGFTSFSERMNPEEVVTLINEYLSEMTEVIFRHGGTIDKFEGDAILALFGAPEPHENDPERALRAALDMRDQMDDMGRRWSVRIGEPLRMGIGINTGQVMVGNIGSNRRMDYTVIGDAVNLASRLQDLTKEYGTAILMSGTTQSKVANLVQTKFLGATEVRGRQQSVDLYEAVGLEPAAANRLPAGHEEPLNE